MRYHQGLVEHHHFGYMMRQEVLDAERNTDVLKQMIVISIYLYIEIRILTYIDVMHTLGLHASILGINTHNHLFNVTFSYLKF